MPRDGIGRGQPRSARSPKHLAGLRARRVYEALPDTAASTLRAFAADRRWLGGIRNDVHFRTRINRKHGRGGADEGCARSRVTQLDGTQFIERLLQHVVARGVKRIRHYGLLAPTAKTARLDTARVALGCRRATRPWPRTWRSSCAAWRPPTSPPCMRCGRGRWQAAARVAPVGVTATERCGYAARWLP